MNKLHGITKKQYYIISCTIFICLFLALSPVILSDNYLRQDDLKTGIWWGMKMSDEGYLYFNTVYQLVRPLCMVLFYFTDMLSINIHYAVYARLMSLIVIGLLGILLFHWQLLFNSNRLLATAYAIAAFTLPGIQLFAATANNFLIVFGLLLTTLSALCWYYAYISPTPAKKYGYYLAGYALFFASFLNYPLSSMYIWVLLAIVYLNTLESYAYYQRRFFYYSAIMSICTMVVYFIFIQVFHWLFSVDLNWGRPAVIDTSNLMQRFIWPLDMLVLHANLWFYQPVDPKSSYLPLLWICLSCVAAFIYINFINGFYRYSMIAKKVFINLAICFLLFLLAYSPILALPYIEYTFRYTIATMPLLMYLLFWSVNKNIDSYLLKDRLIATIAQKFRQILFVIITAFGIYYANLMVADGIVGPQTHDFEYIEQQLNEKVVPLLKNNQQVVIHVIDCDQGRNYHFEKGVPDTLEYYMRLCMYPNHLIGAINHSLMALGYISNFHRANTVLQVDKELIVKDIPWGYMIFNSVDKFHSRKDHLPVVTIDMRATPPYKHLEFYKHLSRLIY